jgi:beta-lactamase regulating signal transducer with metallopeptidase domain
MLSHLADVSLRSLLLALVALVVLLVLRRPRTAAFQHAVWTAVLCGMLTLFAFGQALPRFTLRILNNAAHTVVQADSAAVASPSASDELAEAEPIQAVGAVRRLRPIGWSDAALTMYSIIAGFFLARLPTGMLLVRKLIAISTCAGNFSESNLISVPVTVGWLRPSIVLPPEWRGWDGEKLNAVPAHEGAHVRRRDGLVTLLSGDRASSAGAQILSRRFTINMLEFHSSKMKARP